VQKNSIIFRLKMSSEAHPMTDELVKESHLSNSFWFRQFDHSPLVCPSPLFSFHVMQNVIKAKNFPFSVVPTSTQFAVVELNCSSQLTAPLIDAFFKKALDAGARLLTFPFLAAASAPETKNETKSISVKSLRNEWKRRILEDIRGSKRMRAIYMRPGIRHRVLITLLAVLPPNVFKKQDELPFLFQVLLSGGNAQRVHQDLPVWPAEGGLMEYAPSGVWLGLNESSWTHAHRQDAIGTEGSRKIGPNGLLMAIYLYLHRRLSLAQTDVRYVDGLLQSAMHACIVGSVKDEKGTVTHPNSINGPFDKVALKLYFNPRDLSKVQQDNSKTNIKLTEDIYMIRSYTDGVSRNRPMPLEFLDCLHTGMLYEYAMESSAGDELKSAPLRPFNFKWTRRARIDMKSVDAVRTKLCIEHDNFLHVKRFGEFIERMNASKTTVCLFELDDCSAQTMFGSFVRAFSFLFSSDQIFLAQYIDKPAPDSCSTRTLVGMPSLLCFSYIRWASYKVVQEIVEHQERQLQAYANGTGGLLGISEFVKPASFAPTLCQLLHAEQYGMVFDILRTWAGLRHCDHTFFNPTSISLVTSALTPPESVPSQRDLFDIIADILFCERNHVPSPPSQLVVYLPLLLSYNSDAGDGIRLSKEAVERCKETKEDDPLGLNWNLDPIMAALYNIRAACLDRNDTIAFNVTYSEFLSGAKGLFSIWKFDNDTRQIQDQKSKQKKKQKNGTGEGEEKDDDKEEGGFGSYFTNLRRYMEAFEYKDGTGVFRPISKVDFATTWKTVPPNSAYQRDALHRQTMNGKPVLEINEREEDQQQQQQESSSGSEHEIWWQLFAAAEQMYEQKQAPLLKIKSPVDPLLYWPKNLRPFSSQLLQELTPETWDTPIAFVTTINGTQPYFPDHKFPVCVALPEDNPQLEIGDRFKAMHGLFLEQVTQRACDGVNAYLEARAREINEYNGNNSNNNAAPTMNVSSSSSPRGSPFSYPPSSPLTTGMDTSSDARPKATETKSNSSSTAFKQPRNIAPIMTTVQQETTTTRTSYLMTTAASPTSAMTAVLSGSASPMCL
jgi:hypothetical protein